MSFRVAKRGADRNRQALDMFLAPLIILLFADAALWAYGELRAESERKGDVTPFAAPVPLRAGG